MKVALLAAFASLIIAFAAHAGEVPTVRAVPGACNGLSGMAQKTAYVVAAQAPLCPRFLSTTIMRVPRLEQRT